MRIAAYVLATMSREEVNDAILEAIRRRSSVRLTLHPIDDPDDPTDKVIEFFVQQSEHDGFSQHFYTGFMYDGLFNKFIVNLTIPFADGQEVTAKIAPSPKC